MAMFNSYVKLPEGIGRWFQHVWRCLKWTVKYCQHYSTSTNLPDILFEMLSVRWQRSRCGESTVQERLKRTAGVPMKRYCMLWCNDMSVSSDSSNINWTPGSQDAVWSSRMSFCSDDVMRSFAAWRLSESAPKIKKAASACEHWRAHLENCQSQRFTIQIIWCTSMQSS